MALDFSNTAGALFNRIGRILYAFDSANAYLGTGDLSSGGLRSVGVATTNIDAQFASANQELVSGGGLMAGNPLYLARDTTRSALDQWKSYLVSLAQGVLIQMVDDDVALREKSVAAAMRDLIRQMADNDLSGNGTLYSPDDDVDASTVSAAVAAAYGAYGANTGNGTAVASVQRPDARANEHVLAEVLLLECQDDAGTGGTSGSESFSVYGEPAAGELDWDWPKGSGATTSTTAVDPTLDAQDGGQLLTNGDMEAFTSNTPDDWAVLVGVAGTDIFKEASVVDRGSYALKFYEDGTDPLSAITQTFDSSSGTTATLLPNTVYGVAVRAKKSGTLTAGVLELSLVNSSNTILTDDGGTDLKFQVAHGTLTTSYAWYTPTSTTCFVTPKVLASGYKFRVRMSTAIDSSGGSQSVYVDNVALFALDEVYAGGPLVKVVSGGTAWAKGDRLAVTIANNAAGQFQQGFQRLFNMRALGMQLPSDSGGSETIADTLVT